MKSILEIITDLLKRKSKDLSETLSKAYMVKNVTISVDARHDFNQIELTGERTDGITDCVITHGETFEDALEKFKKELTPMRAHKAALERQIAKLTKELETP